LVTYNMKEKRYIWKYSIIITSSILIIEHQLEDQHEHPKRKIMGIIC